MRTCPARSSCCRLKADLTELAIALEIAFQLYFDDVRVIPKVVS